MMKRKTVESAPLQPILEDEVTHIVKEFGDPASLVGGLPMPAQAATKCLNQVSLTLSGGSSMPSLSSIVSAQ